MKIRIGNDFHVAWSVYRVYSGSYIVEDLEVAKNIKVVLRNNFMYSFIPDITIDGNIISFEVTTDKQQLGTYTLELSYDLDDVSCADLLRHITLDRPAFTIVSSTYEGDVVADNINLTSAFTGGINGVNGLSAYELAVNYEGFSGTVEEWLIYLRQPATDAKTEVDAALADYEQVKEELETGEATRITNENSRVSAESIRVTSEQGRVTVESQRVTSENSRISAESGRATAESSRVTTESGRVAAENARSNNETTRITNETARGNAETSRASAESQRVINETTRGTNETARTNAEVARATAETARNTAENARGTNESNRVTAENARTTAETTRGTNETARIAAEASRVNAEQARETFIGLLEAVVTMAIDANHELIVTYPDTLTDDYTINASGELILTY